MWRDAGWLSLPDIMPDLFLLFPFVAAPFVGSFLGVLIRRIPRGEGFVTGRSRCESCDTVLTMRDLVPVLSFMALRGRCRHCGNAISPQHLRIELEATLVPVLTLAALTFAGAPPDPVILLADCVLGWGLLALARIDLICFRLPDCLTLPLLLTGLAEGWYEGGVEMAGERAVGAVTGWVALMLLKVGYRWLRGRGGLGAGDAKLLAAAGAWTGAEALPSVVVLASVSGLLMALVAGVRTGRLRMSTVLPFGPPLALATWAVRVFMLP